MKRIFLLIIVPALLVAMGYAQTPTPSGNTDQINVKGCLGGSEGNYTVAENSTGKIFKITTSSADLKAYVGQDVNLTGHKAATAENSLAITEMNMISVHCTAAAVVPAATVGTPPETASTPVAAAAPATAPDATLTMPSQTVSTPPDMTVERPAPATPSAAPTATVSTPIETASAPAAAAAPVHRAQSSAPPRKPAATRAAAPAPAEPVSKLPQVTPAPVAAASAARGDSPSEAANAPASAAPVAAAPKPASTGSTLMLGSFVVVVLLVVGTAVPLYNRWKKRRLLEQTSGQNLSFTKEAKSDPGKSDTTGGRKAA